MSAAKKRYEEAIQKFWKLQQVEETEEEATFNQKLQELENSLNTWNQIISKVNNENKALLKTVENYDKIKSEYDFVTNRYAMLKELLNGLEQK